jgi:hypothetical protein
LHVANQTETSFQLIDKITVGGKLTDVVFQKKQINKIKHIIWKNFYRNVGMWQWGHFTSCESLKNTNKTQRGAGIEQSVAQ